MGIIKVGTFATEVAPHHTPSTPSTGSAEKGDGDKKGARNVKVKRSIKSTWIY
jgi:hypothetical protein